MSDGGYFVYPLQYLLGGIIYVVQWMVGPVPVYWIYVVQWMVGPVPVYMVYVVQWMVGPLSMYGSLDGGTSASV